jgi:ADP-heptose:LPS heptosyltransferase
MSKKKRKNIIFIRRDNIGDLVCTTPAIYAVKERYPDARIGVLVNSYNADVLVNNPDVDDVYIYRKAKHNPETNRFFVWWNNLRVLQKIRRDGYDIAIGCGSYSRRLARYTVMTGAGTRIGYLKEGTSRTRSYTRPLIETDKPCHEVERTFSLLSQIGINTSPGPLRIFPLQSEVDNVKRVLDLHSSPRHSPLIAIHISSRRDENRWPADRYIILGEQLQKAFGTTILLLWSPGSEKNVFHPGDDEKAAHIISSMKIRPVGYRTTRLVELVAALSLADIVICCDGGAMHIAAALGKPIVAIWGSTDPDRWRPWNVSHILLQDSSKRARNISVDRVLKATGSLLGKG